MSISKDRHWYKDAVIYQVHVRSFCDSNGDGIGDIRGLTSKLDYIKSLGVTAVWILPFYPSPLKDDGYDISDYYGVHPEYGTLKDFKDLLRKAHSRGLRVITELVINHTSDQHPWFRRARQASPGTNHRDYYVWSDTPDKYPDARIIFTDFESSNWTWDSTAGAHYWHRFYSHQPDLNFDNQNVQKEILRVLDFWFNLGVDGLRLDAVPYLFEREGTNCENLPETYAFLKKLRKYVDSRFKNKMLLAEANQWPEDAVEYFGKGDMCHMAFHFPLMPRMYMSVQMEERFPITDILSQTPEIPASCQWATFLRNHDELTLEMVTDEERDYMYRAYAKDARSKINIGIRRRLVPLLGNNRKKIELMNILLFSLIGTPVIYYGDEIGMGDNHFLGDRNGVRTPMQWTSDRNAGFSNANPQKLFLPVIIDPEYNYGTVNVETQENNLSSLLWWMRRVINMRRKFKAFTRGTIEILVHENTKVLSFIRKYRDETILVVMNLSRFSQVVELDLKEYAGSVPVEVFSQNDFPIIRELPYILTLGPHNHFWFLLGQRREVSTDIVGKTPELRLKRSWKEIFSDEMAARFENDILPGYLKLCRWFGGKSRKISSLEIIDKIMLSDRSGSPVLLIIKVNYSEGLCEKYLLPLSFVYYASSGTLAEEFPKSIVCRVKVNGREGYIYDGVYDRSLRASLLELISRRKKAKGSKGYITGVKGKSFKKVAQDKSEKLTSHVIRSEQSNSSIIYDNVFYLKMFRKLEDGVNPDVEVTRYLTEKRKSKIVPAFCGMIEYRKEGAMPIVVSLLEECSISQSDGWTHTIGSVRSYYERVISEVGKASREEGKENDAKGGDVLPEPGKMRECIDVFYADMVKLLGRRTGELHLELSKGDDNPDFRPEPFSLLYQKSLYQSMGSQARRVLGSLRKNINKLPESIRKEARDILAREKEIDGIIKLMIKNKFTAKKIRIHGDYHLGQTLFTGKDFIIFDFEGEPARSLSERRIKRSVLQDIAGMMRSFHYAAYAGFLLDGAWGEDKPELLETAADIWYSAVSEMFVQAYFETTGNAKFLPKCNKEFGLLMKLYLLDKAIYEIGYELDNRPGWLIIPLRGVKHVLDGCQGVSGQ